MVKKCTATDKKILALRTRKGPRLTLVWGPRMVNQTLHFKTEYFHLMLHKSYRIICDAVWCVEAWPWLYWSALYSASLSDLFSCSSSSSSNIGTALLIRFHQYHSSLSLLSLVLGCATTGGRSCILRFLPLFLLFVNWPLIYPGPRNGAASKVAYIRRLGPRPRTKKLTQTFSPIPPLMLTGNKNSEILPRFSTQTPLSPVTERSNAFEIWNNIGEHRWSVRVLLIHSPPKIWGYKTPPSPKKTGWKIG